MDLIQMMKGELDMMRVLIVEDDSRFRASLAATLSDEYVVHSVSSGRAAVEFLSKYSVDVILLDMRMDEGDGFFVLGRLGNLAMTPKVLVISGLDDIGKVTKAMRLGAHDYLVKPVSLATLKGSLRHLVGMDAHHRTSGVRRELMTASA